MFRLGGLNASFTANKDTGYRIHYFTPLPWSEDLKDIQAMEHFAEHLNGVLEGKVRNDEGRLVEVKLHDKPQADGSIGVAISSTSTPKQASFTVGDRVKVCKPGSLLDNQIGRVDRIHWTDQIEVSYEQAWELFDPSELQLVDGDPVVKQSLTIEKVVKDSLIAEPTGNPRELDHSADANKMVDDDPPPKGWRYLKRGETLQAGDVDTETCEGWLSPISCCIVGVTAWSDDQFIRRIEAKQ